MWNGAWHVAMLRALACGLSACNLLELAVRQWVLFGLVPGKWLWLAALRKTSITVAALFYCTLTANPE